MLYCTTKVILFLFFVTSLSFLIMLCTDSKKQKGMIITVTIFLILSIILLVIFYVMLYNIPKPIGIILEG